MAGVITIELKGLRFFGEHGMYNEEMKVGNEFEVDLSISYKAPKEVIRSIDQTVNYVELYRIIAEELAERKQLLETCVIQIANRIGETFEEVKTLTVSVRKINAPIANFIGSVGVRYSKEFK